ncbi:MAG: ABC transporter permease subunit [Deltaproteobacteria bacterium]
MRVLVLLEKELREIRRSRGLLFSMSALPITMLPVPIVLVAGVAHAPLNEVRNLLAFYFGRAVESADPRADLIGFIVRQCVALFMVMPLFIPVLIAAQSVAGEKERRTIEPLLASPLTAWEIVLGKSLAAVVPALGITWTAFAIFAVGVDWVLLPLFHRLVLPDAAWLFGVLVLAPLLCFLGNTVTVLVSSRVNDSRLAQQLSALIVVPLLALIVVQLTGVLFQGARLYLWIGAGAAVLDVLLFAIAVRLFDRQRILSRWG